MPKTFMRVLVARGFLALHVTGPKGVCSWVFTVITAEEWLQDFGELLGFLSVAVEDVVDHVADGSWSDVAGDGNDAAGCDFWQSHHRKGFVIVA